MITVSATEFRRRFSYYLALSQKESVNIAKNGSVVAVISNPKLLALQRLEEFSASLPAAVSSMDGEEAIGDEIWERCIKR